MLHGTSGLTRSSCSNVAPNLDYNIHADSPLSSHVSPDPVLTKSYILSDANDTIPAPSAAPLRHKRVEPHGDGAYCHHTVGVAQPASATCASTSSTWCSRSPTTSTVSSEPSATWEQHTAGPCHQPTTTVILPAASTRSRGGGFSPTAVTQLHAMYGQL